MDLIQAYWPHALVAGGAILWLAWNYGGRLKGLWPSREPSELTLAERVAAAELLIDWLDRHGSVEAARSMRLMVWPALVPPPLKPEAKP